MEKLKTYFYIGILLAILYVYFSYDFNFEISKKSSGEIIFGGANPPKSKTCEEFPNFINSTREGMGCLNSSDCMVYQPINYTSGELECVDGRCVFEC